MKNDSVLKIFDPCSRGAMRVTLDTHEYNRVAMGNGLRAIGSQWATDCVRAGALKHTRVAKLLRGVLKHRP
jgi:hypothetical protein